jgi:histidinol dehydrogenase
MTMNFYDNPSPELWNEILKRPVLSTQKLYGVVGQVLEDVRANGDEALRRYEKLYDHAALESLAVSETEFLEAEKSVPQELKHAIATAHSNIERFHSAQSFSTIEVETCPGVQCWQRAVPIDTVGLYVPGGSAPLFSTVLMLAVPAKIAGCRNIVLCTPPGSDGKCNSTVLYTAKLCGVTQVFKVGGSQAIAAMAYGTESVPRVNKIFGPGNQYVTTAKQLVSLNDVAIDMPAGPSEVEVIADSASNPVFVAADLLSQAEHGPDSQVMLVTDDRSMAAAVENEINRQLAALPRRSIAEQALNSSKTVLFSDTDSIVEFTNSYAPEHLVISTPDYAKYADGVVNAGSVFLGPWACESAGDYASGTNHTLPTKGYARAYSGLNLDSFMRKMTLQYITPQGIESIGKCVETMAGAEGLDAHRNAMSVRVEAIENKKG